MTNPAIRWHAFLADLRREVAAARASGATLALLLVEVREFHGLNLRHGFNDVEGVMRQILSRLAEPLKKATAINRTGPNRLALILPELAVPELLPVAAQKLFTQLAAPYPVGGGELAISPGMGLALFPDHGNSAEALLAEAEHALGIARDMAIPFAIPRKAGAQQRLQAERMAQDLEKAVADDSLTLHYQPQVDLATLQPAGAEALMRWAPSIDNPVSPDHFIPLAETSGKIQGLTEWALNTAMRETMELDPDGALSVSVNVSASSLYDPNLVLAVESGLAIWGLPPRRLTLEITEGALMKNPALCFEHLARLRALGVRVAIDDFGTGFSSLAYFKTIPADEVKIDQAFVRHMATDDQDARIVQLIIDLAHAFGLKVVAEGVESGEALARLGDLHCDLAQGFYLARPLDYPGYRRWLADFDPTRLNP